MDEAPDQHFANQPSHRSSAYGDFPRLGASRSRFRYNTPLAIFLRCEPFIPALESGPDQTKRISDFPAGWAQYRVRSMPLRGWRALNPPDLPRQRQPSGAEGGMMLASPALAPAGFPARRHCLVSLKLGHFSTPVPALPGRRGLPLLTKNGEQVAARRCAAGLLYRRLGPLAAPLTRPADRLEHFRYGGLHRHDRAWFMPGHLLTVLPLCHRLSLKP